MVLDRTWNKWEQKLTISYINSEGKRDFFTKYLHHIKTYEYDDNGDLDTWNNKKCIKVFKDTKNYIPNEFDILEYMYQLEPETLNKFHAMNFAKLYTFDIETKYVKGEFPDSATARHEVTAISVVGPDLSCIVFGLHHLGDSQIDLFRQRYLNYIDSIPYAKDLMKNNNWEPKVFYQYFKTEEEMLKHFFTKIVPQIAVLAGWNSYRFDWQYLINRLKVLFGEREGRIILKQSSPTKELDKISWKELDGTRYSVPAPNHTAIMDYMELVKKYDFSLRPYESFSLDWVSSAAFNAHKIPYDGDLDDLYNNDIEWYYFYNAVDSLLVQLIHYRLKCIQSPSAVSSVTLVPLVKSLGQVALTTANIFEEFYKDNRHVVYNENEIERIKFSYEGAFCGCVPGRYSWNVCDDFASLYPSMIRTCNLSMENFVQNYSEPDSLGRRVPIPWTNEELDKFRKDKNYFVSVNGNVYKNDKDYAFKRMQADKKAKRDKYKYTGERIENQLMVQIDDLIEGKDTYIEFSDDIKDIVKNRFDNVDLFALNKDELVYLKGKVKELKEEYFLLEIAMKDSGNAAYGAAANVNFYFYNLALAGDITGECRNLTKTMIKNLENFFRETLWERKDLWKQFDFALDESKHDWFRKKPCWIYSDTDSLFKSGLLLIKYDKKTSFKNKNIESLFEEYKKLNGLFTINASGHELVESDASVLNYKDGKLEFTPIKYIIRHKVSKSKFKIKTKSGKEVIVTGDHSCIVFRDGKQLTVKAKDINIKTDKILSVKSND